MKRDGLRIPLVLGNAATSFLKRQLQSITQSTPMQSAKSMHPGLLLTIHQGLGHTEFSDAKNSLGIVLEFRLSYVKLESGWNTHLTVIVR